MVDHHTAKAMNDDEAKLNSLKRRLKMELRTNQDFAATLSLRMIRWFNEHNNWNMPMSHYQMIGRGLRVPMNVDAKLPGEWIL